MSIETIEDIVEEIVEAIPPIKDSERSYKENLCQRIRLAAAREMVLKKYNLELE